MYGVDARPLPQSTLMGGECSFLCAIPALPPPSPSPQKALVIFSCCFFFLLLFLTENPISLPGMGNSEVYVNTVNMQYLDDAEDFLYSEVLSNYGDLLVGFSSLGALQNL